MDVGHLMERVNMRYRWAIELKEEQKFVIDAVVRKTRNAIFAVLPTGYGKSLMYILPPLMLDCVRKLMHFSFKVLVLQATVLCVHTTGTK